MPLATPDVSAIQKLVGAITILIASGLTAATSFGVPLTVDQDTKLLGVWAALGAVIVLADSIIRSGRSKAHAAIVTAQAQAPVAPAKPATRRAPAK